MTANCGAKKGNHWNYDTTLQGRIPNYVGTALSKVGILIDTSVWLDLVKDPRQLPVLETIPALIEDGRLQLILPSIILDEFSRNRDRVIADSRRSLGSHFRLVRQAIAEFSPEEGRDVLIAQLNEIDHRIAFSADAAPEALRIVETLFESSTKSEITEDMKCRAADRALEKVAPFHRQRNSMADALLLEVFAVAAKSDTNPENVYVFITHNTQDFSEMGGDSRRPHPDIAALFNNVTSKYVTSLGPFMADLAPDLIEDMRFFREYNQEPRRLSELLEAEHVLFQQVWYNRKWGIIDAVEKGKTTIVSKGDWDSAMPKARRKMIVDDIWNGMLNGMKEAEAELGKENLGPWSNFEWGMINGKLSALRWVLGDDWDMLDT